MRSAPRGADNAWVNSRSAHRGTRRRGLRRALRHARLRFRLTAMVAIPLIAVIAYAIGDVGRLLDDRARAHETAARASRIEPLSRLSFELRLERTMSESSLTIQQMGLSPDSIRQALGVDLGELMQSFRRDVNDSVDRVSRHPLGLPSEAGGEIAKAIALRPAIDRNAIGLPEVAAQFDAASRALDAVAQSDLESVSSSLSHLPDAAALARTLTGITLLVDNLDAHSDEMIAIGRYAMPALRQPGDRTLFAASVNRRIDLVGQIDRTLPAPARDRWIELQSRSEWKRTAELERVLLSTLGFTDGVRMSDPAPLVTELISVGSEASRGVSAFLRAEAARLADEAAAAGRSLDRDLWIVVVRGAFIAIFTAAFALVTIRSIERPLRSVEQHARAVSKGMLNSAPIEPDGPSELVVVAEAMNELGSNLRRLASMTDALASGQIDSPALAEPLPGPLGRSVQLTVDRLASMTAELREDATEANAIVEGAGDPIFMVNRAGIFKRINAAAERLFGYSAEWLIDTPARRLLRNGLVDGENAVYRPDGPDVLVELTVNAVPNSDLVTVYARDITSARQREQELTYQARHDSLTGLANRAALVDSLQRCLDERHEVTLFFLDLDGFKAINDTHGHAIGDELLAAFGRRIKGALRSSDIGARFGGDEFVAGVHNLADVAAALSFGQRLIEIIEEPFQLSIGPVRISASVGVARPHEGESVDDLIRRADSATYSAKAAGKGRVRVSA